MISLLCPDFDHYLDDRLLAFWTYLQTAGKLRAARLSK